MFVSSGGLTAAPSLCFLVHLVWPFHPVLSVGYRRVQLLDHFSLQFCQYLPHVLGGLCCYM